MHEAYFKLNQFKFMFVSCVICLVSTVIFLIVFISVAFFD